MVLCMSFIGAVVMLEAWPVYALFSARFRGATLSPAAWASIVASFAAVVALIGAVWALSVRTGLRYLEAIEP